MPHVWKRGKGDGWRPKGLVGAGQSIHSVGLVLREICILGQRATFVYVVNMFLCYSCFSPLQYKNKPNDGVTKQALILGVH
jgi:hypothetical protein